MPSPPRPVLATGSGAKEEGRLPVHFASGTAPVPLFNRTSLGAGDRFAGPAIVSQLDATTLILPNWAGQVHPSGAILLTMLKGNP
jgi:N-methylhydantoinase A